MRLIAIYFTDPPSCSVSTIGKRVLKFVTKIVENLDKSPAITCS